MASKARSTAYIVLREQTAGERFALVGEVDAVSADAAIKLVVGDLDPDAIDGNYVAVPERSFQVVPVQSRTETRLVIGKLESADVPTADGKDIALPPPPPPVELKPSLS